MVGFPQPPSMRLILVGRYLVLADIEPSLAIRTIDRESTGQVVLTVTLREVETIVTTAQGHPTIAQQALGGS